MNTKKQRARLIKLQQAQTRKHLSTTFSVFEPATCEGVIVYGQDCEQKPITQRLADSIGKIEVKWTITLYILAREKNGKNKVISTAIDILTPCKHSDIREQIADAHWNWIQSYKWQDTILTAAWIACGHGIEPTEEQAYKIFEDIGVWRELIAEWEQ